MKDVGKLLDAYRCSTFISTEVMFCFTIDKLQSTVDAVEALFKRHEDFENTLVAQEEKIQALDDMADKLIGARHPDSKL